MSVGGKAERVGRTGIREGGRTREMSRKVFRNMRALHL